MGTVSEGLSRGELMLKGAIAAGALAGVNAFGPFLRAALAADSGADADVLNYLLLFEYLQEEVYARGLTEVSHRGDKVTLTAEERKLVETLHDQERQHVGALTKKVEELGGVPTKKGKYAFSFREVGPFFNLATQTEQSAIWAFNGAIPTLKSVELQELAASIVQVDARHAAIVLRPTYEQSAPKAFEPGRTQFQSLNSVRKFTGILSEIPGS